ncbi:NVEALA domain-containing protein [Parabacteroides pacaensis]|uniref:NVEALA domain-containing protein n=1 Tax=Parabacteroides pacaensis TaxID=2086575 RepID=UPI000D0FA345|nr:NVEALA domain-containing protein [Parabacteroides pacaensis]
MKKKLSIIFILAVGCSIYSFLSNKQQGNIPNIALANVEALAGGEISADYICIGSGSLDCPDGTKAAQISWLLRLAETE